MHPAPGKREQSKRRTRTAIRQAGMQLFLAHGFDAVTTTQIAVAAGVSPATLFNYFATKEDLFFGQVTELERRLVELVDSCPPGASVLQALKGHVLWELTAGRSESEPAAVATFHHQVVMSARLQAREAEIYERREAVLTAALARALAGDPVKARIAAHLYVAAERLIAAELRDQIADHTIDVALRAIPGFIDEVFHFIDVGVGELSVA